MAKNYKHIHTSRIERWRRRNKRAIVVIPMCCILPFFLLTVVTEEMKMIDFLSIFPYAYGASLMFLLIYFPISQNMKKAAVNRATFNVAEDYDYYREKLSGLSPVTISILMDLEVETEKDIAASVLRLTLLGVLSPDGKLIDANKPGILPSDEPIISGILRGGMTMGEKMAWRKLAVEESVASGYVETQTQSHSDSESGCLVPIVKTIVLVAIFGVLIRVFHMGEGFEMINQVNLEAYQNDPRFLTLYLQGLLMYTVGFLMVIWPYMSWVSSVFPRNAAFRRTKAGEIATEKIAGMKNFLRDFSNLSEAHKQQLILWDDFLVYAVVLEENRVIVDEILSRKGLVYQSMNYI